MAGGFRRGQGAVAPELRRAGNGDARGGAREEREDRDADGGVRHRRGHRQAPRAVQGLPRVVR